MTALLGHVQGGQNSGCDAEGTKATKAPSAIRLASVLLADEIVQESLGRSFQGRVITLRYVASVVLLYAALCGNVVGEGFSAAQGVTNRLDVSEGKQNDCGGKHEPGDRLACRVTFDGKAEFAKVEVVFNLQTEKDPAEAGMFINFVLRESCRVGKGTYEVSGVLPPETASGMYLLAGVSALMGKKGYRLYQNGYGFKSDITVEVKNAAASVVKTIEPKTQLLPGPVTTVEVPPETEEHERELFPEVTDISERAPGSGSSREPAPWFYRWFHRRSKQESCGGSHKPGDRVSCYVSFERNAAFSGLYVNFNLLTDVHEDQRGLCNGFLLQTSEKVDNQTYKVTGVLPACAEGRYSVSDITARNLEGRLHLYKSRASLKRDTTLELRNSHQKLFPDVKDISPN